MKPGSANAGPAAVGYRVDDLLIDMRLRRVTRDGTDLKIVGRSFELLVALVSAAPRLVSTGELMEQVWPGVVVNPETVTQRAKLLRNALGDDAENPRYIVALRGFGYRMATGAERLTALPDPVGKESSSKPSVERESGMHWHTRTLIAPALGLALILGAAVAWSVLGHRHAVPGRSAEHARPLAAAPRPSVAVLPFANLTGTPAKDYVGDGMAEELINALARVPELKVPARTSTFAYKARNADIRQIAGDLGVATVLEGSVRSAGEHLRISARLVDAASGYQIWSQDYDRQFTDIFKLQDDLAAEIVRALRSYMNVDLRTPAQRRSPTRDVQAYDLYLQAEAVFRGTPESDAQSIAFLDQALARDPDYADALARRAADRAMPAVNGAGSAQLLREVYEDATHALALDPSSADGHATQEIVQALHWRWLDAEQSYRATMVTSADDAYFRNFHSTWLLRPTGRLHQNESELIESYRLAPADGYTLHELSVTESLLAHDAEAVRYVALFHELVANGAPVSGDDALPYARRAMRAGHYTEAARWATLALSDPLRAAGGGAAMLSAFAALADPTQRPEAARALRRLIPNVLADQTSDRAAMFIVAVFVMVGDLDGAYDLMARFLDRHIRSSGSGGVEWAEMWSPEMRPFRRDSRFAALISRLHLMDYWKQYGPPDECDLRDGTLSCR